MIVHQVLERTGDMPAKDRKTNTVYAKCGKSGPTPAGKPWPKEFTIWGSDVTCKECM